MNILNRVYIRPRLTLCLAVIILLMLGGDVFLLWQFHIGRLQADRLTGEGQELIAVVRLQRALVSFDEKQDELAQFENADRLSREAGPLRAALLEETEQTRNALTHLPPGSHLDPAFLPTLEAIETTLPSQLDAIASLANAGDWAAVRLRLARQKKPLETQTSLLVKNIEQHVGEELAGAVQQVAGVQRRILLIVPLTALFTLLIAALLGLAITRSITEPLTRLVEGSQALARGEFHHQVLVIGQDELAQFGQVFNLTARRLGSLYETLHKREAYLVEAQRLIHAGSWAWRVDDNHIFWSEETFHIFAVNLNTTPTREIFLERVHPEDRAGLEPVETALLEGRDAEYNYRIVLPDNSIKYVRSVAHPVTNDSGQVIELIGTVIDITERKQAEEEREKLRQAQADLAHISRVTTMGELTASLAHEIKQPITAAVTNAKTCLRWLARDQPDVAEAREAALRLVKDVTRAASIISSISLLFKKGPLRRVWVDINELIREMTVLLQGEASRHTISIRTELAGDLPNVMADPVQLQQVFMNLMLNGIDAMKKVNRGCELVIKSQQVSNDQLQISVIDSGVGLPAGRAHQIFDAFFTTKPQGLGLGLSISRSIIESHGGRLWAAANPGAGASFQFVLPIEAKPPSMVARQS